MKRVYVSGSYDIINAGHCRSLKLLKDNNWYVIVGLNSDELMMAHKGRVIIPFEQRKEILLSLKYVDEVVKVDDPLALDNIKLLDVDIFATVQEWVDRQSKAIDWIIEKGGRVQLLPYYPEGGEILSCTMIRKRVIQAGS